MSKSEKRAQTFLYIGVLLALIAADWHWYLDEFAGESFVTGLSFMKVVYVLWIGAIIICLAVSAYFSGSFGSRRRPIPAKISAGA